MEDNNQIDITELNTNLSNHISELCNKYKENPYVIQRLKYYISSLTNTLEQDHMNHEKRIHRTYELTNEQENFYKVFLNKHKYYYLHNNNYYYEYDGQTYRIIKEDDIHHKLLTTITEEGKLMQWKHKTKQQMIKKIKERSLFTSIPETYTIQNVLGFLNTIFEIKDVSKYFLTIIGDGLLKKSNNLIFFVNANTKKFISYIDMIGYSTTGNSNIHNFVTKYHDTHNHENYRLIKTNDNFISEDVVKDILNKIGIDLLCVASHYSTRYESSEQYLQNKISDPIKTYTLFLYNNPAIKVIDQFIQNCLAMVSSDPHSFQLSWKNMHYIWKLYLSTIGIPNMIYSNTLKDILKQKLSYKEENNEVIFVNITSKYLPHISNFLQFWEKNIIICNDDDFDEEYEIDEILTLFKQNQTNNISLTDTDIVKIITHFFSPQVEIIDNKYVTNIKSKLWNKIEDIHLFLNSYKLLKIKKDTEQLISFDDLYKQYNVFSNINENKLIVSKNYFEKYITYYLMDYIHFEHFVSSSWLDD